MEMRRILVLVSGLRRENGVQMGDLPEFCDSNTSPRSLA